MPEIYKMHKILKRYFHTFLHVTGSVIELRSFKSFLAGGGHDSCRLSMGAPRERRCDDAKLAFFILYK